MKKSKLSLSLLVLALSFSTLCVQQAANAATSSESTSSTLPSLAPILKQSTPALVTITVNTPDMGHAISEQINSLVDSVSNQFNLMFNTNFAQLPLFSANNQVTLNGSGVIIDAKNGYVLTYAGLVNDATSIKVTLNNKTSETASLVGIDPQSGIAILKLSDTKDLSALSFANSSKLQPGDYVLSLQESANVGPISKLGIISAENSAQTAPNNLIITNATDGKTGGFLLNTQGQLLGLIIPGVTVSNDLGVALPSNTLSNISEQIIKYGHVQRGSLGVTGMSMNSNLAQAMGSKQTSGAFISQVIANSAAEKAGIQAGDIITEVNKHKIDNFQELQQVIESTHVGQAFPVTLDRSGKELTVNVTLTDNNNTSKERSTLANTYFKGVKLTDTKDNKGVEVTQIRNHSLTHIFGLRKGDIITEINNTPIDNLKDLAKVKIGNTLAIKITRGNENIYLVLQDSNN